MTEAVRDALGAMLAKQEESCVAHYMAGRSWPEVERLALLRMQQWQEDFFTAGYDDLMEALG